MPAYHDQEYWEERYSGIAPDPYDWYHGYASMKELLHKLIPTTANILQVGVGTSRLQEDMVCLGGYQSILNVDYSKYAIMHMSEAHSAIPQLEYRVADCRCMPEIQDDAFDAVLDKGTLDAMLCGQEMAENSQMMMEECFRVLRPGGTMLVVTYGAPHARLPYFVSPEYPAWGEAEVYCIHMPQQQGETAPKGTDTGEGGAIAVAWPVYEADSDTLLPPVLEGPFACSDVETMEALSTQDSVHFVYVLRKSLS